MADKGKLFSGQLPDEMMHHILEHLSRKDLNSVSQANKYCRRLTSEPRYCRSDNKVFEVLWRMQNPLKSVWYQYTNLELISDFTKCFPELRKQIVAVNTILASFFFGLSSLIVLASVLTFRLIRPASDEDLAGRASLSSIFLASFICAFHFPIVVLVHYFFPRIVAQEQSRMLRLFFLWATFALPLLYWNARVFHEFIAILSLEESGLLVDSIHIVRLASLTGCTVMGGLVGMTWASVLEVNDSFDQATDAYAIYLFAPLLSMIQQHYYAVMLISTQGCFLAILIYIPSVYLLSGPNIDERLPQAAVGMVMGAVLIFGIGFRLISWVLSSFPSASIYQMLWLATWFGCAKSFIDMDKWEKYVKSFCEICRPRAEPIQIAIFREASRSFYTQMIIVHAIFAVVSFSWLLA